MNMRAEFGGKIYEFPDGTTPEEMASAIEAQQPSVAGDVAKSIPSGIARGVAGLVGLPEDVAKGVRWTAEQAGRLVGSPVDREYIEGKKLSRGPTGSEIVEAGEKATGVELHKPETRAGKYAGTVAEFIPGIVGPGGVARNALRYAAAPGVASEAAGQATEGTQLEPWARFAGGLFGLGAGSLATRRSTTAEGAVAGGMRNLTDQQIAAAQQLITDAQARGVALTLPEAVQQVTDSATTLGNLQRVTEASQAGGEVMRPFMAQRPAQVERAFDQQMGQVAAVPMAPSSIGPRASEAAEAIFENTRRGINRRTDPDYRAAAADTVPDRTMRRLHAQVPGFTDALAAVRGNPHLNRDIATLPDNSVSVLNEVKKQLDTAGANSAAITNPNRNMQVASSNERSAAAVRRAGRRASAPYRRALDEQERLRRTELQPMREGIIGRVAEAGDTRAAANALLPETPIPNTRAETARATRAMVGEDVRSTQNLIRSRLESGYQTAARDVQSGASEFAGAAGRKKLYGDRQLRRNIRAALGELPNGAQIRQGMDRLMEIFQATGRRQHIGSQTEFNRLLTDQLSGGRALGEITAGSAGFNPMRFVRDRYRQWTLGRNMDELARLMTDPQHQARLIELSRIPRGDPRGTALLATTVAQLIEGERPQ